MTLAPLFLSHTATAQADVEELEPLLQELLATGRAGWPDLPLRDEDFILGLARLCPAGQSAQAFLLNINYTEDLFLACACAQGLREALLLFEERYLRKVAPFLQGRGATLDQAAEVAQILWKRLLVAEDGPLPKIATYSGKGSLLSWVYTAAVRVMLNLKRDQKEILPDDGGVAAAAMMPALETNPEMALIKRISSERFKEAFHEALATLPPDLREVMRLHHAEGLDMAQLAQRFSVDRSTVSRWLIKAREHLQRETRRVLKQRMRLTPDEVDSMAGLVRSKLDLSLVRGLGGTRQPA